MAEQVTVRNLMTANPVTVTPETSLIEAANILSTKRYSGLPVVNKDGLLVGILTENDLITKGSAIHLPTFLKLFEGIEVYRNDALTLNDDVKKILAMRVKDVMNAEPLLLFETATVEEGLKAFAEHHRVNPIPIVDNEKKLKGVLSRHDIIKMFGSPAAVARDGESDRALDAKVNTFVSDFEKQFLLVSKTRTHYWLLWSLFFVILGFLIAFGLIVQIGGR